MALYEGIALIQEKQAVVLDLGTDYTKFGFTGEASPRCIVRSEFWCPATRRYKRVHSYKDEDELYDNLVHMLHTLYFRHVLVNPKERKVVVVESLLTPTLFRETLARVLYTHYEVSGVVWADSARLCALCVGTPCVLVVSIGAVEAEVTPVVHSSVVLPALQGEALGARAVRARLAEILDEDNGTELNLPDHVLEDIMVKTCFVSPRSRAVQWDSPSPPAPARDVTYRAAGGEAGGELRVSGRARERAAEVMFERDNEQASLPDIILKSIMQSPRDWRRELAGSVLVCGGAGAMPGLRARLQHELQHLLTQPPYRSHLFIKSVKFHRAPAHDNSVAWVGGALAGAAGATGGAGGGAGAGAAGGGAGGEARRVLAREQYSRTRRLADWTCILDRTPPHHPARDHAHL